eukprot:2725106-Rhodomonas_salina.1
MARATPAVNPARRSRKATHRRCGTARADVSTAHRTEERHNAAQLTDRPERNQSAACRTDLRRRCRAQTLVCKLGAALACDGQVSYRLTDPPPALHPASSWGRSGFLQRPRVLVLWAHKKKRKKTY